jgi:hypothetical protein
VWWRGSVKEVVMGNLETKEEKELEEEEIRKL